LQLFCIVSAAISSQVKFNGLGVCEFLNGECKCPHCHGHHPCSSAENEFPNKLIKVKTTKALEASIYPATRGAQVGFLGQNVSRKTIQW